MMDLEAKQKEMRARYVTVKPIFRRRCIGCRSSVDESHYERREAFICQGCIPKEMYRAQARQLRIWRKYQVRNWACDLAPSIEHFGYAYPAYGWPAIRNKHLQPILSGRLVRPTSDDDHAGQSYRDIEDRIPILEERGCCQDNWYVHLRAVAAVVPKRQFASVFRCKSCRKRTKTRYALYELDHYKWRDQVFGVYEILKHKTCSASCYVEFLQREESKAQKRRQRQWQEIRMAKRSLNELRNYLKHLNSAQYRDRRGVSQSQPEGSKQGMTSQT